jgi:putative polyketide hydroxylase
MTESEVLSSQADRTTESESRSTEVLIVGGGPAGLAAAVALGRLGVDTILLERRSTTSTHPRGHVENGRTMELFRLWGVDEQVREQGLPKSFLGGVAFMTRLAGIELGTISFRPDSDWLMGHDGQGPASLSSTPQDRLEPILLKAAQACPSVTVHFGAEVKSVVSEPDGVRAVVHGPDGVEDIYRAQYLIAADGPRSRIRGSLGIEVDGPGTLGNQLGIYFHADLSDFVDTRPNALYWLYNPDVQGVIISLDGKQRWHLLFAYDADNESIEDFPPERCEAVVRGLVGSDDIAIDVRSVMPWRMRAAVARTYRSDRIFLAGDAAHTMPPTGGMGMNTGIGDAHNLAWKLHAVLRGNAGAELLDTYEPERLPVGQRNTENSVENARTMAESGLAGIMVHDPEGFAAIEKPTGTAIREQLAAAIPGQTGHFSFDGLTFGYIYDSAAIIPDGTEPPISDVGSYRPTAAPGARAPHLWLQLRGKEISTIDLSDGRFVVLSADPTWVDAARRVNQTLQLPLAAHVVDHTDEVDQTDETVLRDPDGAWSSAYGVGAHGAVLIRPDGHVAWRTTAAAEDQDTVLRSAIETVLHKKLAG